MAWLSHAGMPETMRIGLADSEIEGATHKLDTVEWVVDSCGPGHMPTD